MACKPTYEIDWKIFELALQAGFEQKKIALAFQIDADTLNRKTKKRYNGKGFKQLADSFCCKGEMYLTIAQYQKALDDKLKYNTSMLMHLGKVRLGQKEHDISNEMPKNDEINAIRHKLMELQAENDKLRAQQNQPKAEPELCGGDPSV